MTTISLNMKFWDDGQRDSTRVRNVNFTWKELKKLSLFLTNQNVKINTTLYDFSVKKIIPDSKHVAYPFGVYKKAEKTNIILKDQKVYDFFMMIDCDAFFYKNDYNNLLSLITNLNKGDVCTFDLAKLESDISKTIDEDNFDINNIEWSYAYAGDKKNGPLHHHSGGLGGVYICDTDLLLKLGGFDEKYEGWGGEDGDMFGRIWASNIEHTFKPVRNFAPFHLPHFSDWGNENYAKRFVEK